MSNLDLSVSDDVSTKINNKHFQCEFCEDNFNLDIDYQKHMCKHRNTTYTKKQEIEGKKQSTCELCGVKLTQGLQRHMNKKHKVSKTLIYHNYLFLQIFNLSRRFSIKQRFILSLKKGEKR